MSWVLDKVIFENFMRIRKSEIDIPHSGVIGILAKGSDDPDRSNFLGKSSVPEGIKYALTGDSRASKETELIHHGQESMYVELQFVNLEKSGEKVVIKRGRDIKNNGLLEFTSNLESGDKKQDAQKRIDDFLGMSKSDFDMTVFFKQAEINQFMSLSPTAKKKLLMEWQKNDHWQEFEKKVLEDIKAKKEELRDIRIKIDNLNTDVGDMEEIEDEYASSKIKLSTFKTTYKNLTEKIEEMESGFKFSASDFQEAKREMERLKRESGPLKEKSNRVVEIDRAISNTDGTLLKDYDMLSEIRDDWVMKSGELNDLKHKIKSNLDRFKKIEMSNSGLCPIIDEPCDRIVFTIDQISNMRKEINALKEEYNKGKIESDKIESRVHAIEQEYKKYSRLKEEKLKLGDIEKDKRQFKKDLIKAKEVMEGFDRDLELKIKEIKQERSDIQDKIDELNKRMGYLESIKNTVEKNEEKAEKLREEYQEKNVLLEDLNYLAFTFGKNGIPSLEIENSFEAIEEEMNYNLSLLGDIQVEFKPDRELNKWEENCLACGFKFPKGYKKTECRECNTPRRKKRKDELTLSVIENGNEMSFDMCSGGLKTLVSMSIRTALTQLLRRQNKCNSNMLFLDEIDSALDKTNKEKIVYLITNVLHKKLGFSQIFWISHDKNISHNVPYTLLVKGYKDYSKLEWI